MSLEVNHWHIKIISFILTGVIRNYSLGDLRGNGIVTIINNDITMHSKLKCATLLKKAT